MGHAGCSLEQGRQFPLCAIRCLVFECPTCGDHETDHRPGQILTEYQRPDDGEEGDDIHAGRAPAQTANQGGSDRNEGEPGRPGPEYRRQDVVTGKPGAAAAARADDTG